MRRVLLALVAVAPSLHAQVTPRTDTVLSSPATSLIAQQLVVARERSWVIADADRSLLVCGVDRARALEPRCAHGREARSPLDSTRATRSREHTWLGALLGLGLGAGAGYLVAIPRVHATERTSDGPLQQIEYVVDPVVGGILGGAIGAIIGSRIP